MSRASSPAPAHAAALLGRGLRAPAGTGRARSYSIASYLQTAEQSRGGCPEPRFTGVSFPFQVPEISEWRPGPSHFLEGPAKYPHTVASPRTPSPSQLSLPYGWPSSEKQ